jgi:hypothetical protein
MQAELAAAEPQLANPVAFTVTATGDVYVCETFRQQQGVEDNRGHMNWLLQDLQLESIEERIAMFRRFMGDEAARWETEHDRIRLLRDTDGDGVFDSDTVFADGFSNLEDGTGAGVLELDAYLATLTTPPSASHEPSVETAVHGLFPLKRRPTKPRFLGVAGRRTLRRQTCFTICEPHS